LGVFCNHKLLEAFWTNLLSGWSQTTSPSSIYTSCDHVASLLLQHKRQELKWAKICSSHLNVLSCNSWGIKLIGYLGHKFACNCLSWRQSHAFTFVCSSKHSGHQQDSAFKEVEPAKTIQALATHPQKQRNKLCPFNNYIPLLGYGNMTLSRLPFPTDTHISDNCTKEQSCRSTMSLLRRLKAPTLRSTAKKHWYWVLGKNTTGE